MDAYIERLQSLRAEAVKRQRDLMEQAEAEKRDLTPEEIANVEATDQAIGKFAEDIAKFTEMADRAKAADTVRSVAGPVLRASGVKETDSEIIRSVIRGNRTYAEFLASEAFDPGRRTLTHLSDGTYAAAVPQTFYDQVQVYMRTLNPTYSVATVIPTPTGSPLIVPRLTADPTVYTPGYGTAITAADPTISSITLVAWGYKSLTYWTQESDQDNAVNLDSLIAMSAGRSIGYMAGSAFTLGNDSAAPNGFITAATNGGTASGSPFFDVDDLISLFYGLAAPYREAPGAVWQVSNAALIKMRKFKSSTGGDYLWQPSFQAGQPDRFMGKPVFENPHMAAAASASKSVAFGDFKAYFIREVNGLRVERSTDYAFNTDLVALKCVWRVDGDLPDTAAIKYLVSASV